MKYNHKFAEVESGGLGETASFKIAASGKAFRSLIDSIYSLKIDAPVRELMTNAWDAHIAAGKIEPFHVHLPTPIFPTFFVRDFGCSMTHEFVMQRYTTLFDSTKDGTVEEDVAAISPDKQVGSWGLGSKTPFTYTDAFTLTCWLDGEVRTYHIFIGANGRPDCALAHRGPSDEPTGVKVEFPVKTDDHDDFEEVTARILKGFNILPTGLPADVVSACQKTPQMTGSFFKVYETSFLGKGYFARQGCVLYPIDLAKLGEAASGFGSVSASVVIDFPIGSIEYTNSREYLSYTPATVQALSKAFEDLKIEVEVEVTSKFNTVKNAFERASLIGSSDLFSLNRFSFLTPANKLRKQIGEAFAGFLPWDRSRYSKNNTALYAVNALGERATHRRFTFASDGEFPGRAVLVYCDENTRTGTKRTTGIAPRIGAWMTSEGHEIAYVFEKMPSIEHLRKAGFPPVVRLTGIPELPKAPRVNTGGGGSFARFAIPEAAIPADALYVFINRGQWIDRQRKPIRTESLNTLARILDRQIVTINTRSNEKLDRWDGFDFIYDYTMTDVIMALSAPEIEALIARINWKRFSGLSISSVVAELYDAGVLKLTPLATLSRFYHAKQKAKRRHSELLNRMSGILYSAACDDDETINTIIERGRALGLEILMPLTDRRYHSGKPLDAKLVPKVDPMFIRLIQNNHLTEEEVAYITKEVYSK